MPETASDFGIEDRPPEATLADGVPPESTPRGTPPVAPGSPAPGSLEVHGSSHPTSAASERSPSTPPSPALLEQLGPRLARPEAALVAAVLDGRQGLRQLYGVAAGAGSWEALVAQLERARGHLEVAIALLRDQRTDDAGASEGASTAPPSRAATVPAEPGGTAAPPDAARPARGGTEPETTPRPLVPAPSRSGRSTFRNSA
jgi:hypothetical protein